LVASSHCHVCRRGATATSSATFSAGLAITLPVRKERSGPLVDLRANEQGNLSAVCGAHGFVRANTEGEAQEWLADLSLRRKRNGLGMLVPSCKKPFLDISKNSKHQCSFGRPPEALRVFGGAASR
jgi:hypothetical protein